MSASYREIFFATHGVGPYKCFSCGEIVLIDDAHIHHVDHDHTNDQPENLTAAHYTCHARYHALSRGRFTEEHRRNIGVAAKRRQSPPAFIGTHTEESKQKMRVSARARGRAKGPMPQVVRDKISMAMKAAPKSLEHRARLSAAQQASWRRRKERLLA